jgi:anti-sigma regulatory factor (Ser/Thr protein kinase)
MSRPGSPDRYCSVEFQAMPSRIAQVRRILSAQLRYWHLDPLIDRAALGVTELLANVHRHAGPDKRCIVEIALQPARLTVSVRDRDPNLPMLRETGTTGALTTSGRGLALVAAVSDSWGMEGHDDGSGKTVWFALPLPSPAAAAQARQAASRQPAGGVTAVADAGPAAPPLREESAPPLSPALRVAHPSPA